MTSISYEIRDPEDILRVLSDVERHLLQQGYSYQECLFIRLATEESCMNSYEYCEMHGFDCFQAIITLDEVQFQLTIIEEGRLDEMCFSPPEGHSVSRGRGLMLIREIMDDMSLKQKGSKVYLSISKRRSV